MVGFQSFVLLSGLHVFPILLVFTVRILCPSLALAMTCCTWLMYLMIDLLNVAAGVKRSKHNKIDKEFRSIGKCLQVTEGCTKQKLR